MTEGSDNIQASGKRERSPSFPYISLEKALGRAELMDEKHKKFATILPVAAQTWGLGPKSSALLQTVATLKAYGLIIEEGRGKDRKIAVSDLARSILHDTRPGMREEAMKKAALKPKLFSEFFELWRTGRPSDSHCISELKLDRGFTEDAAKTFLRVFDANFQFANLGGIDKIPDSETPEEPDQEEDETGGSEGVGQEGDGSQNVLPPATPPSPPPVTPSSGSAGQTRFGAMEGERELITGPLSRSAGFRLIVSGQIGLKEIERLIAKLELEKDILADPEDEDLQDG